MRGAPTSGICERTGAVRSQQASCPISAYSPHIQLPSVENPAHAAYVDTVFAAIDHSGEARGHGLELRDTKLIIFGSPTGGTPVMQASPLAALDLPLKVLVWDDGGQTKVSYTDPDALAVRHHLSSELASRLAGIGPLTDAVVG